jgi:NodT family efflux transporter outer membrane factor (OMF) lipoprotein
MKSNAKRDYKVHSALVSVSLLIIGLWLLSACNTAPKYAKPPAPAPAAFKEAVPQEYREGTGWKIAQPGDDRIRNKWWEMYNDPQLNALEEHVQVSNQSIIQAEANFRSSRAAIASARASLFPVVGVSASYTNSRFSQTARTTAVVPSAAGGNVGTGTSGGTSTGGQGNTATGVTGGNAGIFNNFSLPIDVSYSVDLWHKVRNTIAANSFTAQASAAEVATALLSTRAELAQDYFQIRALDAERAILQDTLENYRRALNLTNTLFQTGLNSEQDVAQAKTQLDTVTAQATDLGVSRAQFEHAIAALIGKPAATFSLLVAPFIPTPPAVPVALPSQLLERRPDIAAAERQVAAANAQIGVARAAYYPNLALSFSGGFQTAHFLEWFTWPSRFWSVGPQLAETVLDFGARRAANELAQAAYDATVANYRQTVLTAFQAVEDNLASVRILSEEAAEQHTAVNSATRVLDLSLTRYRAGVDSYLNVITAQNTVLTNRQTEVQIQLRRMMASISLIMSLGGDWDASQLPHVDDLIAKQAKRSSVDSPTKAGTQPIAAPNPPPLSPASATPGAPSSSAANPLPANTISTRPPAGTH